jgi:hypothetical protein
MFAVQIDKEKRSEGREKENEEDNTGGSDGALKTGNGNYCLKKYMLACIITTNEKEVCGILSLLSYHLE